MTNMMERLKSPVVIAGIVSAVLLALASYGVIPLDNNIKAVVDGISYVVLGVGIFNNPTDKEHF